MVRRFDKIYLVSLTCTNLFIRHLCTRVFLLCGNTTFACRDARNCVDLSAADGAVVILAANTIAEEFSEGTS